MTFTTAGLLAEPKYTDRVDRERLAIQAGLYAQIATSTFETTFPAATPSRDHGPACARAADTALADAVMSRLSDGTPS